MAKYLLVTADDFGMCHAVNAGIAEAMTNGIVRSTNFLVPCPWFSEALVLAREHGLKAGVHLCLTCDWDRMKWRPLTSAPSLVDENGHFFQSYAALAKTAKDEEMWSELDAQIACVKRAGHRPTHLDSHMLCAGDDGPFSARVKAVIESLGAKYGLIYTYEYDGERGYAHFDDELCTSSLSEAEIWRRLESFRDGGVYHLIGHPALPAAELEFLCSPEHPSRGWASAYRVRDRAFFTDPKARERLSSLGFELIDVPRLLALRAAS